MYICVYIYIYVWLCVCIYIYIYIYIHAERDIGLSAKPEQPPEIHSDRSAKDYMTYCVVFVGIRYTHTFIETYHLFNMWGPIAQRA